MHLAIVKVFRPQWTSMINQEWKRNLLINRPNLEEKKLDRTINLMSSTFPDANVLSFEHHIPLLSLPDENDKHVFAAAIECNADFIVTFNLKDFPDSELLRYDLKAIHPDSFVCNLFETHELFVRQALSNQVMTLVNPPKTQEEVLIILAKCGLKKFATLF